MRFFEVNYLGDFSFFCSNQLVRTYSAITDAVCEILLREIQSTTKKDLNDEIKETLKLSARNEKLLTFKARADLQD